MGNGSVKLPQTTFTSGISLAPGDWTWFGAGKEENSTVDDSIANQINSTTTAPAINSTADLDTSGFTRCLAVTFVNKQVVNSSTEETYVALEFAAVPCVKNITTTICEVRVYEQVWYVWFTTNWLQILFLCHLPDLGISAQPPTPWHNPKAFRRSTSLLCEGRATPNYKGKTVCRCGEVH